MPWLQAASLIRTYLKNRILVQDRGGAEFQTGGILLYVEDLKLGTNKDTNKDIGPKDIFEMDSKKTARVWIPASLTTATFLL
jgi:hypothetical protein